MEDGEALSSEIVAAGLVGCGWAGGPGLGLGQLAFVPLKASEQHEGTSFLQACPVGVHPCLGKRALGPVLGAVGQLDPQRWPSPFCACSQGAIRWRS